MKKPFEDPIDPKKKKNGNFPWDYKAPSYDNRTSNSICAGDDYGNGFRTPVGKEKASSLDKGPIPQKTKCFSPNEIFKYEDVQG